MDTDAQTRLSLSTRFRRSAGRDGRTKAVSVKLNQAELSELNLTALSDGKATGEWAREVLLREARRSKDDALFTEVIATRMLLNLILKPLVSGEKLSAEAFSGVLTTVRTTKRKTAKELMEQYTTADERNGDNG